MLCSHWHAKRKVAENEIKTKIERHTIIKEMIKSEGNGNIINKFFTEILKKKEQDEREKERNGS